LSVSTPGTRTSTPGEPLVESFVGLPWSLSSLTTRRGDADIRRRSTTSSRLAWLALQADEGTASVLECVLPQRIYQFPQQADADATGRIRDPSRIMLRAANAIWKDSRDNGTSSLLQSTRKVAKSHAADWANNANTTPRPNALMTNAQLADPPNSMLATSETGGHARVAPRGDRPARSEGWSTARPSKAGQKWASSQ